MWEQRIQNDNKQIKAITYLGIGTNVCLSVVKLIIGILSGSISLVADGVHSLSDMTTDLVVLLGVHVGSKAPDEKHPYGHGRAETFSAGFIALVLILVGMGMIYYAALDMVNGHVAKAHWTVLVVASISILVKEILYRLTRKVAMKTHSAALYANSWHHRSDALSSVVVVVGYIVLKIGFVYGDQVAAVLVGLMISMVGFHILGDCIHELTEASVDKETFERITSVINADPSIHQWHKLRTRAVGREVFLDLHILVDPELSITAAHEICESLENTLHAEIPRPVNITVHVEPDLPELRK